MYIQIFFLKMKTKIDGITNKEINEVAASVTSAPKVGEIINDNGLKKSGIIYCWVMIHKEKHSEELFEISYLLEVVCFNVVRFLVYCTYLENKKKINVNTRTYWLNKKGENNKVVFDIRISERKP